MQWNWSSNSSWEDGMWVCLKCEAFEGVDERKLGFKSAFKGRSIFLSIFLVAYARSLYIWHLEA
jgi:hypothetical protein